MAIHLSGLPGGGTPGGVPDGQPVPRFDLAPGGVYLAGRVTPTAGALLPHRFTLACAPPGGDAIGGLFSVALSCRSPRLAVNQHPALWSPDLPRLTPVGSNAPDRVSRDHPADSPSPPSSHRWARCTSASRSNRRPWCGHGAGHRPRWSRGGSILAPVPTGFPASPARADGSDADALSINGLYARIDRALKVALPGEVWVSGEVRSFSVSGRGHCYLDLVDPRNAQDNGTPVLKVVCWSSRWSRVRSTLDQLGIVLDAGLVVRVKGEVQLYKPRGDISLILSELDTDALLGKVAAERARLVKALVDEDLFDRNRRIPVPRLPLRVGLVASPATEGYSDFMGQLVGSGMAFEVRVAPSHVQGRDAAASVAAALRRFRTEECDVLVVVRGGGSKADLATFDSEAVARAIATSTVPVWTGIGHTGDQSVADEVANRSFITPTECGQELARLSVGYWRAGVDAGAVIGRLAHQAVTRSDRLLDRRRRSAITGTRSQLDRHADRLVHRARTLRSSVRGQVVTHEHRLATTGGGLSRSARRSVASGEDALGVRRRRLAGQPGRRLQAEDLRVAHWRRLLGAYDYQRQLERGYSVTRGGDGLVVRSAGRVAPGELLYTRLADGEVVSAVTALDGGAIDGVAAVRPSDNVQRPNEGKQ